MADIRKSVFETQYGTPAGDLGVFQDNSNREISELDMRQFAQDIADSLFPLWIETPITAANFKACGGVPVSLVSAPGSPYILTPYRALLTKNASLTGFDFVAGVVIKTAGGDNLFYIDPGELTTTNVLSMDLIRQGQKITTGAALILTTDDGSDATVGDGSIKVKVYYKIEQAYI